MIQMGMGHQDVGPDRRILPQLLTQAAHAGAGVEDDEMLAAAHFQAGGVAAVTGVLRSGAGD